MPDVNAVRATWDDNPNVAQSKGGNQREGQETLSAAEEEAPAREKAGLPCTDRATPNSAKQKVKRTQKLDGTRNKQKRASN